MSVTRQGFGRRVRVALVAGPLLVLAGLPALAAGEAGVDERFRQAEQALHEGRVADGQRVLEGILKADPRNRDAANLLGNLALAQGRAEEAGRYYDQALEADPLFAETYNNLGVLALQRGQVSQAMTMFQTAVRIDPGRAEAWYNLGRVFLAAGKVAEAERHLRRAAEADPAHVMARQRLAVLLLGQKRGDEAVPLLEQAVQAAPEDPAVLFLLATVRDDRGETEKARDLYLKARAAGSTNPRLPVYLAEAYLKLRQPKEAERELRAVLADPKADPKLREAAEALSKRAAP